jgi:hypothetical protein
LDYIWILVTMQLNTASDMKSDFLWKGRVPVLLLGLFLSGCSTDFEVPEDFRPLSFEAEEVLGTLPAGLKHAPDSYAQSCYSYIESAVDMSVFIDNMEIPEDAWRPSVRSAPGVYTWQWNWLYKGGAFTLYWRSEDRGGKRCWSMDIRYGTGPCCDYLDAWETLGGSEGELRWNYGWEDIFTGAFPEDHESEYWRYNWKQESDGSWIIGHTWDSDDPAYDIHLSYDVVIDPDGSGVVDYFLRDELFHHMEWDHRGNGSWLYYEDGEVFLDGTWTAGV